MFGPLKNLFAKKPQVTFRDPELGLLSLEDGIWSGSVAKNGRELKFHLGGAKEAPDPILLNQVRKLFVEFEDTERIAKEFLLCREAELAQAQLSFYFFEFLWEDKPEDFTFEFMAENDDTRIWRVEFVGGQPSTTGFDD